MPLPIPKFIRTAFAQLGQRNSIPETTNNITGAAGYNQGFGEINMLPEGAGGIPPDGKDMNGILYELSAAIQFSQAGRYFPFNQDFATAIGGYGKGALVTDPADLSIIYQSTIDSNLVAPPSAGWQRFPISPQATYSVAGIAKVATSAILRAGTNDDSFATAKGLKDSGLWPLGVGQTWQDMSGSRVANTNYTNATGRPIAIFASLGSSAIQATRIFVGGIVVGEWVASGSLVRQGACAIIPPGAAYQVNNNQGVATVHTWSELR